MDNSNCGGCGIHCTGASTCSGSVCSCPPTCAPVKPCGPDGCGGWCGACSFPDSCGGGGTLGECGCTPATILCGGAGGTKCGSIPDGCGGSVDCGGCSTGFACVSGTCEPTDAGTDAPFDSGTFDSGFFDSGSDTFFDSSGGGTDSGGCCGDASAGGP
jgi:hypothetical protein